MKQVIQVTDEFFIKSKTNSGEYAKQYFKEAQFDDDTSSRALIIRKYVLSDKLDGYPNYDLIKTYKGFGLFLQKFSIKTETLNMAIDILNLDKY